MLISSRDRLIQVEFLHRIYYKPQRLHNIYPERSADCTHCKGNVGTYMHMFWSCHGVACFWIEVVKLINLRLQLTLPTTSQLLLLGIHDDDQRSRYTKLLNQLTLLFLCTHGRMFEITPKNMRVFHSPGLSRKGISPVVYFLDRMGSTILHVNSSQFF